MKTCPYQAYYNLQAGSGVGSTVFRGAAYQRGHGLGSFFSSLFRSVVPIIRKGAGAIGREALRTGVNFLGDLSENRPVKESFQQRISEAGGNLKRKAESKIDTLMTGSGYKKKRTTNKRNHFRSQSRREKNKSKRALDIFDK